MRTDAKIGFAIGGVLLAVLTVYAIVVPRHSKKPANTTVSLVTPIPAPSVSSDNSSNPAPTPPSMGAADAGSAPVTPPVAPVTPSKEPVAPVTPGPGNGAVADNTHNPGADGFHPVQPSPDHLTGHLVDNGIYTPGTARHDGVIAHSDPVKTLPDDTEPTNTSHDTVYTVKPGQTLSKIAYEVYGNSRFWVAIQRENKTLDPKHLKVGSKINLPDISPVQPGADVVLDDGAPAVTPVAHTAVHTPARSPTAADAHSYIVKSGDSLYGIAKRLLGNGRKAEALYELNKEVIGADKARLKLGMVLKLPEAATRTAMAE
jgi:nucleoid-associated protein YgaU